MSKADRQKVFTKVKRHLLKQNKKSIRGSANGGICLYRGPRGLKCAIGCLIKDKFYSESIEGGAFGDAFYPSDQKKTKLLKDALKSSGIKLDKKMIEMLDALQATHDSFDPPLWEEQLMSIAEQLRLKY